MKKNVNLIENASLISAAVLLIASIVWGALIGDHHIKGSTTPSWMAAIAILITCLFLAGRFLVGMINEAINLKEKIQEMRKKKEILFSKFMYFFVFFVIFPVIVAVLITIATGIVKLPVQGGYFADNILHTSFSWLEMGILFIAIAMANTAMILKSFGQLDLKLNFSCK